MEKIKVKPEGREGVYIVEKDEAERFVESLPCDTIHNFIGGHAFMLGADWTKSEVINFLRDAEQVAIVMEPNITMRHHLVALTADKRYSFDVGVIAVEELEVE